MSFCLPDRVLVDACTTTRGAYSFKSKDMEEKKGTINFDELAKENRNQQPRFKEEVRRNEKGEVVAYVLKRNK